MLSNLLTDNFDPHNIVILLASLKRKIQILATALKNKA